MVQATAAIADFMLMLLGSALWVGGGIVGAGAAGLGAVGGAAWWVRRRRRRRTDGLP